MHQDESPFIAATVRAQFDRPGRFIERSFEEYLLGDTQPSQPVKMLSLLKDSVGSGSMGGAYAGYFVEVIKRDGMSWSAHAAYQALRETLPHYTFLALSSWSRPPHLPAVASLIGVTPFLQLAVRSGVTSKFYTLRSAVTPLIFAAAALAAVLEGVLSSFARSSKLDPSTLHWSAPLMLFALTSGGLFVLKFLITERMKHPESTARSNFSADLEKAPEANVSALVNGVEERLSESGFPRVLVVDNYAQLDELTKTVLTTYLERRVNGPAIGGEIWLVFEPNESPELMKFVSSDYRRLSQLAIRLFRQTPLTHKERVELVDLARRPTDAVEFRTAAGICLDDPEGRERILQKLRDWRALHPADEDAYSPIDLLHLIGITAEPGETVLEQSFLVSQLSNKSGVINSLAGRVLIGTKSTKDEVLQRLAEMRRHFSHHLQTATASEFRVLPDVAAVLEQNWRELQLQEPGKLHLLWAFLWLQMRKRSDALRQRKLAHHLLHCDRSLVFELDGNAVLLDRLADAYTSLVLGCLQTCLLSLTPDLLAKAATLYDGRSWPKAQQRRFVSAAWEAYNLLGDEQLLTVLLERLADVADQQPADDAKPDALELLFLETTPLQEDQERLALYLTRTGARRANVPSSLADYGLIRAAWLVLASQEFTLRIPTLRLAGMSKLAEKRITEITNRVLDELAANSSDAALGGTALITVSIGIWTQVLVCDRSYRIARLIDQPESATRDDVPNLFAAIKRVVELSTRAVGIAEGLRSQSTTPTTERTGHDLLHAVLSQELAVVALVALAFVDRMHSGSLSGEVQLPFKQLATRVNKAFGFGIPVDRFESPALIDKLNELMWFSTLLWRRFGFDTLADMLNLRRVLFRVRCAPPGENARDALLLQADTVGLTTEQRSFTGVMANLTLASCYRQHWELSAQYVHAAANHALDARLGRNLCCDLALIALHRRSLAPGTGARFFRQLLVEVDVGTTALADYLVRLSGRYFVSVVADLMGVITSESDELQDELANTLEKVAARVPDEQANEVRDLLVVDSVQRKLRANQNVDLKVLDRWVKPAESWAYAKVIELLLQARSAETPRLKSLAFSLLERDAASDQWNAHFQLATTLGSMLTTADDRAKASVIVRYLRAGDSHFAPMQSAKKNVQTYEVLERFDPENTEEYREKIRIHREVDFDLEHMFRLPQLERQGKYFLVFVEYFVTGRQWGLLMNGSQEEAYDALRVDDDEPTAALIEWRNEQAGRVPEPLLKEGKSWCVNLNFLRLGMCFFIGRGTEHDKDALQARRRFDDVARSAFPRLLEMVTSLPQLPASIADLVHKHRNRFEGIERLDESSIPPDMPISSESAQPAR